MLISRNPVFQSLTSPSSLPGQPAARFVRLRQVRRILIAFVACVVAFSVITRRGVFADTASTDATPLTVLRGEVRELLTTEATAAVGAKKDAALTALCDLYVVLRQDKRYADSEMLQQDANKIRSRLMRAAKKRKNQLKRDDVPRPSGLSGKVDTAIQDAIKDPQQSLGKSVVANPANQGRAAAGGAFDNGWQLVELMQRVVEPDFWEVNGGPGAIHYFAIRRVLVVRATSDVHEQIKDLLLKLPR